MIAVFNYGRIESLLGNLSKLVGVNYDVDTLVIYDCSSTADEQLEQLRRYCSQAGLVLGQDVVFRPRANWGLAEGGRIDLADELRRTATTYPYLLQFQEHYLDTTSSCSIWPAGTIDLNGIDVSGRIKGDCLRADAVVDLDQYEDSLRRGHADVLYCSNESIGLFPYWRTPFFCIDGVNFAVRTDQFLNVLDRETCRGLKAIWDGTYDWALFAEHYVGFRMMELDLRFMDMSQRISFANVTEIIQCLKAGMPLGDVVHVSETHYGPLFHRYMDKLGHALRHPPS